MLFIKLFLKNFGVIFVLFYLLVIVGCANVKQYQRENLGDPMMIPAEDELEEALDEHNFGNREGGSGGASGSGGGCGC